MQKDMMTKSVILKYYSFNKTDSRTEQRSFQLRWKRVNNVHEEN